jgi:Flp pilus assembly pilin Flp
MITTFSCLWHEDDGVLSFEWTLLTTLLTLGIVAGIAAARDAIIDELGDAAQAMLALDHSMTIDFPLQAIVHDDSDISTASDSAFVDAQAYTDCARTDFLEGQAPRVVEDLDS